MTTPSPATTNSCQFQVSVLGWVNKNKFLDGVKRKQMFDVPVDNEAAVTFLENVIDAATKNMQQCEIISEEEKSKKEVVVGKNDDDDNSNKNNNEKKSDETSSPDSKPKNDKPSIFIRRRHFPIAPHENMETVTKQIVSKNNDIISMTIIDEPTPQIRERKTVIEGTGAGIKELLKGFLLPPGATIVADHVQLGNGMQIPVSTFMENPTLFGGAELGRTSKMPSSGGWGDSQAKGNWDDDRQWNSGRQNNWGSAPTKKAAAPTKRVQKSTAEKTASSFSSYRAPEVATEW